MRAGRLRYRVTIQRKTVTKDAYGAETITWTTLGTYWAAVEPLRGREFLDQKFDGAELTTRIVLRYQGSTDIKPEYRATWDGHIYDILAVVEVDARHREYQLLCREVFTDDWDGH